MAETGAISSVYWALDDRIEVLARVDTAMREATSRKITTAIHALSSVILDAAVEVAHGPVGDKGIDLMTTWEQHVRQSVADRGPEVAFEDTSCLEVWDLKKQDHQ